MSIVLTSIKNADFSNGLEFVWRDKKKSVQQNYISHLFLWQSKI